ncbi:MAG TPA: Gfo/Idh/MocA family oxidoreductase [Casimicrobiaceae bacterium]|nr:Gfo/Idh/MocA family oxidoreductase [Casimicrobiaceae bacterium]
MRIGIAGLGRMGRHHAENLARNVPGAELVAACSPVVEELEWAGGTLGVTRRFADYGAMLGSGDIDAVWLVTPTTLHAQQIVDALNAGKHVFSEKPLSLDLGECQRVETEAVKHPELKVMIGFVRRFDSPYQAAYARIKRGEIGRPFMVRSHTQDKNDSSGFFVRFAETSGGMFLDMSVHDIDCARWLLGAKEPKRVFAAGTVALHEGLRQWRDVDNGMALCEFTDGSIAYFGASRTAAHGFEATTEIVGTGGRLTVGAVARIDDIVIADAHGVRSESPPTFYERFADAFLREARTFVDCVRKNRAPPLTLRDATEATRIGIALRESLLTGRAVEL